MVRVEAVRAVAGMGLLAVHWLMPPLRDAHSSVRREAVVGLGKMGPAAAVAVPDLATLLKDEDVRVRTAATLTLGVIGPGAAPAIPALIRVLRGQHLILSRLAAQSLSRMGRAAVPALTEALATADKYARREAAWALGEVGPIVAEGLDPVEIMEIPADVEHSGDVQVCAAEPHATVAVYLGESVAVPEALAAEPVQAGPVPDALTALTAAVRDTDAKVREAASRALVRIRGQR